jgi:uncharacterized protein (TIGR02246 family)
MNEDATQIVAPIVQALEDAWNAGSGQAFAAPFADDADFVDIRADYHRGKQRSSSATRPASIPSTRAAGTSTR